MHMIPMTDGLGIPMLIPNPMVPMLMIPMIYSLGIPMLIPNSMVPMLMAVLVSMVVMFLLLLLLLQLCFGGWLEPCLIDLHIHCVLGAASVALPDMLLVKGHPIQWLLWQLLHVHSLSHGKLYVFLGVCLMSKRSLFRADQANKENGCSQHARNACML